MSLFDGPQEHFNVNVDVWESRYVKQETNKEKLWEHENTGQVLKGTREHGPIPLGDPPK